MFNAAFSGYSVHSIDDAEKFYGSDLGLNVTRSEVGLELSFKSGHSVFLYEKADHEPASYTVLNFPVENIDVAIHRLAEKNISMLRYDTLPAEQDELAVLRGKAASMGPDIAWFTDPSGNILAILEQ